MKIVHTKEKTVFQKDFDSAVSCLNRLKDLQHEWKSETSMARCMMIIIESSILSEALQMYYRKYGIDQNQELSATHHQ